MNIGNRISNPTFGRAYINMQSINKYPNSLYFQNGKQKIISALKERNTPLKEFINKVINSSEFENKFGDVFISFSRKRHFGEGEDLFDMVEFSFPKLQQKARERMKKFLDNHNDWSKKLSTVDREEYLKGAEEDKIYHVGFRDYNYTKAGFFVIGDGGASQDGAKELQKYLKSSEIVEDLKRHIEKLKKYVCEL